MESAEQLGTTAHQATGTVRAVVGQKVTVELSSGRRTARMAASCMLVPRPGDRVLVATCEDGECFVLAVLTRAEGELPDVLRVDGDLEVTALGSLKLQGGDGVDVRSPGRVDIGSRELGVSTIDTVLKSSRMRVVTRSLLAQATTAKAILETMDTMLDRLSQRVKRSYRFVEELDSTRAGDVDVRAKHSMTMRAKNAFVAAEDLVKLDGEQIHLG